MKIDIISYNVLLNHGNPETKIWINVELFFLDFLFAEF